MISKIASTLGIHENQVRKTVELLDEGATIPFISRYRKEATGSLDEVQVAQIRDLRDQFVELEKRREAILKSLKELDKLSPELEKPCAVLKPSPNSKTSTFPTNQNAKHAPWPPGKRTTAFSKQTIRTTHA